MTIRTLSLRALPLALLLATGAMQAMAQTPAPNTRVANTVQRDVNQQTRIENGLKDGRLNS